MIDRETVAEFLNREFEDLALEVPQDIPRDALVEAFCQYIEDEYEEWLRENFMSFFNGGDPDWDWIKEHIDADEEY